MDQDRPEALKPDGTLVARTIVVENVRLTVDHEGHIKFDGACRVEAVREYRKLMGCDMPTASAAIDAACVHLFGVGLIEFVARLSFGAGVAAQKKKADEDTDPEDGPPPVKKPVSKPKAPAPSPMLNGYDTCILNPEPHNAHVWRNPDATEAVCDGEGNVTVDRLKTKPASSYTGYSSAGHATPGNTWKQYTSDDACACQHNHVEHTWPHSDGMTSLHCDGKQNVTRSGIARAAVMPGVDAVISKLRRLPLKQLQTIALACGMSKAAIVGMTSDELASDIRDYANQHPHVSLGV